MIAMDVAKSTSWHGSTGVRGLRYSHAHVPTLPCCRNCHTCLEPDRQEVWTPIDGPTSKHPKMHGRDLSIEPHMALPLFQAFATAHKLLTHPNSRPPSTESPLPPPSLTKSPSPPPQPQTPASASPPNSPATSVSHPAAGPLHNRTSAVS